jgi:hypothetical protein
MSDATLYQVQSSPKPLSSSAIAADQGSAHIGACSPCVGPRARVVPVLRVWDPARPTRPLTDATELAVSAILEQPYDTGVFHPVAFK